MGFWARSLVEVARRVLCTGEVPGVAFEVEVPEDFLGACLGVLGLMGTEATLDGGRGLKPRSRSELMLHNVTFGLGGGRIRMISGKYSLLMILV